MKLIMTSAAALALAITAPVSAQVLGGGGANVGLGSNSGLTGQVGAAPAGVTGQVNGSTNVGTPILPGAGDTARPAVQAAGAAGQAAANNVKGVAQNASPGAIKDGKSLNTGAASIDASANVSDSGTRSQALLAGGMNIQDMGGMALGSVVSVAKSASGEITGVTIQTTDGVRRTMKPGGLTVKGNVAVTSQSQADLAALPAVR